MIMSVIKHEFDRCYLVVYVITYEWVCRHSGNWIWAGQWENALRRSHQLKYPLVASEEALQTLPLPSLVTWELQMLLSLLPVAFAYSYLSVTETCRRSANHPSCSPIRTDTNTKTHTYTYLEIQSLSRGMSE